MSSHAGATESVASSSTRHNWILLNKHESIPRKQDKQHVVVHKPLLLSSPAASPRSFRSQPARDALRRISSINRLNDRIRRRLQLQNAITDSSASVSEAATTATITLEDDRDQPTVSRALSEASRLRANRVIDDSFRFISDEPSLTNQNTITPAARNRLIQQHESLRTSRNFMSPPPRPPSTSALKRVRTDPLGARPSRSRSDGTDSTSESESSQSSLGPSTSRGPPTSSTMTDSRSAKINQTGLVHTIPIKMVVHRRRAESLDSGSDRLESANADGRERDPNPTPMTISEWQTPAMSRQPSIGMHFRDDSNRIQQAPPPTPGQVRHFRVHNINEARLPPPDYLSSPMAETRRQQRSIRRMAQKTPSLLRRDSYFYRKCDICFNQNGVTCSACGNGFNGRGYGGPSMAGQYNYLLNARQPPRRQLSRHLDADWMTTRRLRPMNGGIVRKASRVPSNLQHRFTAGPPPVTIEPYFSEEAEDVNDESSASGLGDEIEPAVATTSASTNLQVPGYWSKTIPPRAPVIDGWNAPGFGGYATRTSPRRHISERALNVEALQRHPSYLGYRRGPHMPLYHPSSPTPASRQSTVIWPANAGPAWKSIDRRPRASPVFRYGKPLPKWLYDYDAYAEEQRVKEIERRRRKVIAIILIFLFFALIVAAGVVLAAVH